MITAAAAVGADCGGVIDVDRPISSAHESTSHSLHRRLAAEENARRENDRPNSTARKKKTRQGEKLPGHDGGFSPAPVVYVARQYNARY